MRNNVVCCLALIFFAFPAASESRTPQEAMNEFSSEVAECAAYFSITLICVANSGKIDKADLAGYEKMREAYLELLFRTGKLAGVSGKASLARFELYLKDMMKETDKECINIAVLLNRYGASCRFVLEHPDRRLEQFLDEKVSKP